MSTITFLRSGNFFTVDPCPPAVRGLLVPYLSFTQIRHLQGRERYLARKSGRSLVETIPTECYVDDFRQRISTAWGFAPGVHKILTQAGYAVTTRNLTPPDDPTVFTPDWARVYDGETVLRPGQQEILVQILAHDQGRFDCPTGYGKSFSFALVGRLLPRARILIVADGVTVIRDRIYSELVQMLGNVGIIGGGLKIRGRRIMCVSTDSLHWMDNECQRFGDFDIVLVDECHQACADKASGSLAKIPGQPRMFGFSATHEMRMDGKDKRAEGLFGPIRLRISYEQARQNQLVSDIEVRWRRVILDIDPCGDTKDVIKKKLGFWTNTYRNRLILGDAVFHALQGQQVMITCETLEHVLNLRRLFMQLRNARPEWQKLDLVCAYREHANRGGDYCETLRKMTKCGVGDVLASLPYMDLDRRLKVTKDIEAGKILLFVATTIYNVGFNAVHLNVVCRADGGSSQIADTQIPGRVTRRTAEKTKGVIYDYLDRFNRGLNQRSQTRFRHYKGLGWEQNIIGKAGALSQYMHWEED